MTNTAPIRRYKFTLYRDEDHACYGHIRYRGVAIIEAYDLNEAIMMIQERRYDLVETLREPMTLSPLGKDCSFTVEPAPLENTEEKP